MVNKKDKYQQLSPRQSQFPWICSRRSKTSSKNNWRGDLDLWISTHHPNQLIDLDLTPNPAHYFDRE